MPIDRRTLTNEPDPRDASKTKQKRIRTQIHRRTRTSETLTEQWDSSSGIPPPDLKMPPDKMRKTNPK